MMLLLRSHTFNKRDFVLRQVRFEQVVLADEVVVAPSIVFLRVRRKVLQHPSSLKSVTTSAWQAPLRPPSSAKSTDL